jgi:hypothetical protein
VQSTQGEPRRRGPTIRFTLVWRTRYIVPKKGIGNHIFFRSSRQLEREACSSRGSQLAFVLISVSKPNAAKLGGRYFVDDAEIGKVGSCETEQWASSAPER